MVLKGRVAHKLVGELPPNEFYFDTRCHVENLLHSRQVNHEACSL